MHRQLIQAAFIAGGIFCGCSRASHFQVPEDASTEVVPRTADALPVGAHLAVELEQAVPASSSAGTAIRMHVTQPLTALDLSTVVPQGAIVFGHVASMQPGRTQTAPSFVRLEFDSLHFGSRRLPFSAMVVRAALPNTAGDMPAITTDSVTTARPGRVLRDSSRTSPGSVISLGVGTSAGLPAGTKLTLRATRRVEM